MHFRQLLVRFGSGGNHSLPHDACVEIPYGIIPSLELQTYFTSKTLHNYMLNNTNFLNFLKKKLGYTTEDQARQHIHVLLENHSPQAVSLSLTAIRFFFFHILGDSSLPPILTEQEINKISDHTPSLQYKLLIELLITTGLPLQSLLTLSPTDINLKTNKLKHNNKKIPLSFWLTKKLAFYLELHPSTTHLFLSETGNQLTLTEAHTVLTQAARSAGIIKPIHPNSIRLTYVVRLLEEGKDLQEIESLLGEPSGPPLLSCSELS